MPIDEECLNIAMRKWTKLAETVALTPRGVASVILESYEAAKAREKPDQATHCPECGESRYYDKGACLACVPKAHKPNRFENGKYADLDLVQKVADAICKPLVANNPAFRGRGLMDATNAAIDILEAYFSQGATMRESGTERMLSVQIFKEAVVARAKHECYMDEYPTDAGDYKHHAQLIEEEDAALKALMNTDTEAVQP